MLSSTEVSNTVPAAFRGLLFIGDPHLEARVPGFRKDDYPSTILQKFSWCLEFAVQNRLQPFLLGDLFQLPQDNPNWLISQIIESVPQTLPAIHGNHDVRENRISENDSIQILFNSGTLRRINEEHPWIGKVDGKQVAVSGTSWGEKLPKRYERRSEDLVVWMTHHDILIPGYEDAGRIRPKPLSGIDVVINGHIHRPLPPVQTGDTHWITAGNIARRTRSDATRSRTPSVVCLTRKGSDLDFQRPVVNQYDLGNDWQLQWVAVPHETFDSVFHEALESDESATDDQGSGFIADLQELITRKTETGAGLIQFLNDNLDDFAPDVGQEILKLAGEVTQHSDQDSLDES
ncbi:metallophosphoesterase [Crateriforma conspicua]|uniref:metallophosphoesterase n=1 Tax=Crateriforma conspicua TaxID=2527996 RepID=UPI00118A7D2B|nr:metallophosphoesterase [Crateriforma conspicua]QDV65285.1 hypothetical protein Mal65_44550 [Crateriforma conspicua]